MTPFDESTDKKGTTYFGVNRRIIRCAHGLWQCQTKPNGARGTKEFDPWEDLGPPTSYAACVARMSPNQIT
jgi:hypothetical protein